MDVDAEFRRHRGLVFAIAYDITGSVAEARAVQSEIAQLWRSVTSVPNPRDYLAITATRRSLHALGVQARSRREYLGPWLPEPLPSDADAVGEPIPMVLMVTLQQTKDIERAAYVLRETHGFGFDAIAECVRRERRVAMKLASRARVRLRELRPAAEASRSQHNAVVQRFAEAATLSPAVGLTVDTGTAAPPTDIATVLREIAESSHETAELNGRAALLLREDGTVTAAVQFDVIDDAIAHLFVQRNPQKLAHLA